MPLFLPFNEPWLPTLFISSCNIHTRPFSAALYNSRLVSGGLAGFTCQFHMSLLDVWHRPWLFLWVSQVLISPSRTRSTVQISAFRWWLFGLFSFLIFLVLLVDFLVECFSISTPVLGVLCLVMLLYFSLSLFNDFPGVFISIYMRMLISKQICDGLQYDDLLCEWNYPNMRTGSTTKMVEPDLLAWKCVFW